jgi:hypothetical protein
MKKCPGSMAFSQPKPEVVACPDCGADVEIWSDEATGQCSTCSRTVIRTATQSCVDWCRYAPECLGDEKFRKYGAMKAAMRKPALIKALEDHLGGDTPRTQHSKKVVSYAELILREEPLADPNVVIAAAALHDLGGLDDAERKPAADSQQAEEKALQDVSSILRKLEYPDGFIKEVCRVIVDHHCPRDEGNANVRVLHDADLLASAEKRKSRIQPAEFPQEFLTAFLTDAGRKIATELRSFMGAE